MKSMMRINNKTSGKITYGEESILSFFRDEKEKPVFVGTGFLISEIGLFVSAKHVFFNKEKIDNKIFALSLNSKGEPIQSKIEYKCWNNNSDTIIGIITPIDDLDETIKENYNIESLHIELDRKLTDGNVYTYAFPRSEIIKLSPEAVHLKYKPTLYTGKIVEYLDKMPLVNNCGYRCSMPIEPGCSGGPVFHESGVIIGINSASLKQDTYEEPIMFATDISLINNLYTQNSDLGDKHYEKITIKELQDKKFIR
jgi:V8-like Glu-specific endopeptidase